MLGFLYPGELVPRYIHPLAASMMQVICVHEAGHVVVAEHFGCRVVGIAFTAEPTGFRPKALYESIDETVHEAALIHAAGSAAESVRFGQYGRDGAEGDLAAIAALQCSEDYDLLVSEAAAIIRMNERQFNAIIHACLDRLFNRNQIVPMVKLPNGELGHILINGKEGDYVIEQAE